ncbi:hypothetical protein WN51_01034 [Melipona quadrifasciata]|uniref:Uncharacterized protein n=1 Tax=Melipona quadrifasciata TaxID=166423 RepID=A0A0N0BEV4_9HYME|nr:hypothetical protein WN51_01034 [Melipona quadrifasciata]
MLGIRVARVRSWLRAFSLGSCSSSRSSSFICLRRGAEGRGTEESPPRNIESRLGRASESSSSSGRQGGKKRKEKKRKEKKRKTSHDGECRCCNRYWSSSWFDV